VNITFKADAAMPTATSSVAIPTTKTSSASIVFIESSVLLTRRQSGKWLTHIIPRSPSMKTAPGTDGQRRVPAPADLDNLVTGGVALALTKLASPFPFGG
jgi:hypothetical protein